MKIKSDESIGCGFILIGLALCILALQAESIARIIWK